MRTVEQVSGELKKAREMEKSASESRARLEQEMKEIFLAAQKEVESFSA